MKKRFWTIAVALATFFTLGCHSKPINAGPANTATAPKLIAPTVDYQALVQKNIYPDATVVSGAFDAPHSQAIYYRIIAGNRSRSIDTLSEYAAWQDCWLRNK